MKLMTAKFNSQCHETGAKIKKGDSILYDPNIKKAYSKDSQKYKDFNNNAREHIQDPGEIFFDNWCQQNGI